MQSNWPPLPLRGGGPFTTAWLPFDMHTMSMRALPHPPAQLDQRDIAAPRLHEPLQVGVAPTLAGSAGEQDADVLGAQRGPRCRQAHAAR
jgi:hypothetical protein